MHDLSLIESVFSPIISFDDQIRSFFQEHLIERSFGTREFITEAGNVERYFYFVQSGVQAAYLIDQKGEMSVLGFTYRGNLSGVYDSFIYQQSSHYFLESLIPSRVLGLSKSAFDELFERFPQFLKWRVAFIEMILHGRGQRESEMVSLTATERFDRFMKRCPPELLQIPQKYLASYLNMKPETFSRMRGRKV